MSHDPLFFYRPIASLGAIDAADAANAHRHAQVVAQRLPGWLTGADPGLRQALVDAQAVSQGSKSVLADTLKPLQPLDTFAEPLLRHVVEALLGHPVDVRTTQLVRYHRKTLLGVTEVKTTQQSLLDAALQNFEADEPFERGAVILPAGALEYRRTDDSPDEAPRYEYRYEKAKALALEPQTFVGLCRVLDLGGRYQKHLDAVFKPPAQPGQALDTEQLNLRARFIRSEMDDVLVAAHIARMQDHISAAGHALMLQLTSGATPLWQGSPVRYGWLRLLGGMQGMGSLSGMLLIEADTAEADAEQPCLVYMPGEPQHPLKEYPSFKAFGETLREKLRDVAYRDYFQRFIGERYRHSINQRLDERLSPSSSNPFADTWLPVPDPNADIGLEKFAILGNPFAILFQQRLVKTYEDARVLAVPTGDEDALSREARWQRYVGLGLGLLNVAGLYIPVVGQGLMLFGAAQLLQEIVIGADDWRHGDHQAAFEHALNVAGNLALVAAMAGATHLLPPPLPELAEASVMRRTRPVRLADGSLRLWDGELRRYHVEPPADTAALNAEGLHELGSQRLATVDGQPLRVEFDPRVRRWRAIHPTDEGAFRPLLEPLGEGRWALAEDQTRYFHELSAAEQLADILAELGPLRQRQALASLGQTPELLERPLEPGGQPSALLRDTLLRQRIDLALERHAAGVLPPGSEWSGPIERLPGQTRAQRFAALYQASQAEPTPAGTLLQRDFPSLPGVVVEELLARVSPSAQRRLVASGRLPLALAEEARQYLAEVRLNHAVDGVLLASVDTDDSARLRQWVEERLGEPASDPERLAAYVAKQRQALSRALGQRPIKPFFNAPQRGFDTRIGYPLSGRRAGQPTVRGLVARYRALYPGMTHVAAHRLIATHRELGQGLGDLAAGLTAFEHEFHDLRATLRVWRERPLTLGFERADDELFLRDQVIERLEQAWRHRAFHQRLHGYARRLDLANYPLADLPGLPGNFDHITELDLGGARLDTAALNRLLARFPRLLTLNLHNTGLNALPAALGSLAELTSVSLTLNSLTIDQALIDALGRLPALTSLDLSANRVGQVSNVASLGQLQRLRLGNCRLHEWPAWVEPLASLERLDLSGNNLRTLPDAILARAGTGAIVDVDVNYNPFDEATLARLRRPAQGYRRYNFSPHHLSGLPRAPVAAPVDSWQTGMTAEQIAASTVVWRGIEAEAPAAPLFELLGRLRQSRDYTSDPAEMTRRVWRLLDAAAGDQTLRQALYGMAADIDTCVDGVRLVFSDMEIQVLIFQALEGAQAARRGHHLLELGRGLQRLEAVEAAAARVIAGRRVAGQAVDEAEVRMAFRIGLAEPLDLPGQPREMAYAATANVTPEQLRQAQATILAGESEEGRVADMVTRVFWMDDLRERYASTFEAHLAPYAEELSALDDDPAPGTSADYLERVNDIARRRAEAELTLAKELTRLELVG